MSRYFYCMLKKPAFSLHFLKSLSSVYLGSTLPYWRACLKHPDRITEWTGRDSNSRPSLCKSDALPAKLPAPTLLDFLSNALKYLEANSDYTISVVLSKKCCIEKSRSYPDLIIASKGCQWFETEPFSFSHRVSISPSEKLIHRLIAKNKSDNLLI